MAKNRKFYNNRKYNNRKNFNNKKVNKFQPKKPVVKQAKKQRQFRPLSDTRLTKQLLNLPSQLSKIKLPVRTESLEYRHFLSFLKTLLPKLPSAHHRKSFFFPYFIEFFKDRFESTTETSYLKPIVNRVTPVSNNLTIQTRFVKYPVFSKSLSPAQAYAREHTIRHQEGIFRLSRFKFYRRIKLSAMFNRVTTGLERSWSLPVWYSRFVRFPRLFSRDPFELAIVRLKQIQRISKRVYFQKVRALFTLHSSYRPIRSLEVKKNERFEFQLEGYTNRLNQFHLMKLGLFKPNYFLTPPRAPKLFKFYRSSRYITNFLFNGTKEIPINWNNNRRAYHRPFVYGSVWHKKNEFLLQDKDLKFFDKLRPTRYRRLPRATYTVNVDSSKNNIFVTLSYQGKSALTRIRTFKKQRLAKLVNQLSARKFRKFKKEVDELKLINYMSRLGKTITVGWAGAAGYKGPRRSTPSACEDVGRKMGKLLRERKIRKVWFRISEENDKLVNAAIRGITDKRFKIRRTYLTFRPSVPHGLGLRAKKPRRV